MGLKDNLLFRKNPGENRPRLDIPRTPLEIVLDILTIAGLFALIFIVAYYWGQLPEVIPTKFDFNGQVTDRGSRNTLLILPGTGIFTALLLQILAFFPHTYNYPVKITPENAAYQYRLGRTLLKYIAAVIPGMFAYLEWTAIRSALQPMPGNPIFEIVTINLLFILPLAVYFYLSFRRR